MKKELKFIGKKAISATIFASVFVAVAGTSLWALAAFTEPTTGPAASIQDFATNVLGANNTDNSFDSSSVTANADGSVLERLEAIEDQLGLSTGVTAISPPEPSSSLNYDNAVTYCDSLSINAIYAFGDSNTSTTYTDWRLPLATELDIFKYKVNLSGYYWTDDVIFNSDGSENAAYGMFYNSVYDSTGQYGKTGARNVFCVR